MQAFGIEEGGTVRQWKKLNTEYNIAAMKYLQTDEFDRVCLTRGICLCVHACAVRISSVLTCLLALLYYDAFSGMSFRLRLALSPSGEFLSKERTGTGFVKLGVQNALAVVTVKKLHQRQHLM